MGSRNGFDADLDLNELLNVVDRGSGAVSAATRQANALGNLGLTVTQAELNALHSTNPGLITVVGAGSTMTLSAANNNEIIELNTATGSVVTLPAATGSGVKFRFVVSVLATSNSHILYTASAHGVGGSDVFEGIIPGVRVDSGNAVLGFAAASTSNTITLNRSTTGSVSLGEWLEVYDFATNLWHVRGFLSATGAAFATPFSHT